MSSQRGNVKKTGPPKHQNKTAFRNDIHKPTNKQKIINSLEITRLCPPCKQVVEWKIKYKKYKPLSNPKTCVSCNRKNVKRAYNVLCCDCAKEKCMKCTKELLDCDKEKDEEEDQVAADGDYSSAEFEHFF